MIDVSIITIINDINVYNDFLDNLSTQVDVTYELIAIDNINSQFTSARTAYNSNVDKATGKYLIFMHPDVRFHSKRSLADIILYAEKIKTFGVVGVAGCPEKLEDGKRIILSNIVHGHNKKDAGRHISDPVPVQTVDECFFIVHNRKEKVFSDREGWHLYAVELCLDRILSGDVNYVVPANLWHISDGKSLDYKYIIQLKALIPKYKDHFTTINTTVKKWEIHGIKSVIYLNYYLLKQYIKVKIKR